MATLVRYLAIATCALVAAGFITFATDELDKGSDEQVRKLGQELGEPAPSAATEAQRERRHGAVREIVDDSNDVLLAPFTGLTDPEDDVWAQRGVPTLLGLLAYGVGLGLLANWLPKPRPHGGDWREPHAT
jgi:hypothetical protein